MFIEKEYSLLLCRIVASICSTCKTNEVRRGIIWNSALLNLCRHRHKFRARAVAESKPPVSDPCVVLFWMSGGPGHMETWDPKPNAVSEFGGPFGATQTSVPGIQFGELLPEQAKIADKVAILRGVCHGSGDHTKANHWMLTGFEGPAFITPDFMTQRRPSMGSAVAKLHGANRPGLPPYAAVRIFVEAPITSSTMPRSLVVGPIRS
jgi:hypothetical protein